MTRYKHDIDYKLCVPSDVPLFKTEGRYIVDDLLSSTGEPLEAATSYAWVKSLIEEGEFLEHFEYDYNEVIDSEYDKEAAAQDHNYSVVNGGWVADGCFKGWSQYDAPYHVIYYWNEVIESDKRELTKEEIASHYEELFKSVADGDELSTHHTCFEGYLDSKTTYYYRDDYL